MDVSRLTFSMACAEAIMYVMKRSIYILYCRRCKRIDLDGTDSSVGLQEHYMGSTATVMIVPSFEVPGSMFRFPRVSYINNEWVVW